MPTITDVQKLAQELHDKKAINLDMPIRDLLTPQGIGVIDPSGPLQDNVIAWSEYVLVTSGKTKLVTRDAIDAASGRTR